MTGGGDHFATLTCALAFASNRTLLRPETTFLLATAFATWGFLTIALLALDFPAALAVDLAVTLVADLTVVLVVDLAGAA